MNEKESQAILTVTPKDDDAYKRMLEKRSELAVTGRKLFPLALRPTTERTFQAHICYTRIVVDDLDEFIEDFLGKLIYRSTPTT